DTTFSYMNARYYDSASGRFLSEDPAFLAAGDASVLKGITQQDLATYLSDPQQLNAYSYVRNSPIARIDTTGQFSLLLVLFGLLAPVRLQADPVYEQQLYAQTSHYNPQIVFGGDTEIVGGPSLLPTPKAAPESLPDNALGSLQIGQSFGKLGTIIENVAGK